MQGKKFVLAIAVFIGVSLGTFASADILQSNKSTNSTPLGLASTEYLQTLGSELSGTVTTTTLNMFTGTEGGGLGTMTVTEQLKCYDDSGYSSYNASCSSATATVALPNGGSSADKDFNNAKTLDSTKFYAISIQCTNGCYGGTNGALYLYGSAGDTYLNGNFTTGKGLGDLYFWVKTGSGGATIAFTNPTNGYSGADFSDWTASISGLNSLGLGLNTSVHALVSYGLTGGSINSYQDNFSVLPFGQDSLNIATPKRQALWFAPLTATTTWNAFIELYTSSTVLSTQLISFTVTAPVPAVPNFTTATGTINSLNFLFGTSSFQQNLTGASSTCLYATDVTGATSTLNWVDKLGCNITTSLVKVGAWLFTPTTGLTFVTDRMNETKTLFPFSAFYQFEQISYDLSAQYVVPSNTISIPLASPLNFTVSLSSSSLSAIVGSTTASTVRTIETHFLWIILMVGIITLLFY